MPRLALLVLSTVAVVACGGTYERLEKAFPAKTELKARIIASQTIVLTDRRLSGAENLKKIANIGLTSGVVEIGADKPFSLVYSKVQIPVGAIAGCSKTCFGPDKWDADLLLNEVGIQISIENSQDVIDWCWENDLPMLQSSVRRAWKYEGKELPSKAGYVRVSKQEYASQARSACVGN